MQAPPGQAHTQLGRCKGGWAGGRGRAAAGRPARRTRRNAPRRGTPARSASGATRRPLRSCGSASTASPTSGPPLRCARRVERGTTHEELEGTPAGGGDKWRTLEKAGWGGVGPTRQGPFTPPSNQPPCSCWGCWSARHLQMRMPEERPQTKHIPGHSDNSLPLNLTLRSVSNGPDCRLWWQARPLLKMQFDFAQLRTSLIYFDLNVQKITRLSVNNGA